MERNVHLDNNGGKQPKPARANLGSGGPGPSSSSAAVGASMVDPSSDGSSSAAGKSESRVHFDLSKNKRASISGGGVSSTTASGSSRRHSHQGNHTALPHDARQRLEEMVIEARPS